MERKMSRDNALSEGREPTILHLVEYEKFIPPFIDLINENLTPRRHHFFFFAKGERYKGNEGKEAAQVTRNSDYQIVWSLMLALIRAMNSAEKIILHGLFSSKIIALLFFQPWLLARCYWVIWGGDLYTYALDRRNPRWWVKEMLRRLVIKNFGHLISYGQSDIERARKWYGARGRFHECFMYTTNLYHPVEEIRGGAPVVTIQIGNSADPTNEHQEALDRLAPFRHLPIRIVVPLSYGEKANAQAVVESGFRIFGEKFVPLLDFLPLAEYRKLQNDIDIAIFIHRRQQAMGNIIALLGMGKHVFLKKGSPNWKTFDALGIEVFDFDDFRLDGSKPAPLLKNREIIKVVFSKASLLGQLSEIFEH